MINLDRLLNLLPAVFHSYWEYLTAVKNIEGHSSLFHLASRLLKYFLLAFLGFMIALVLSGVLGTAAMAWMVFRLVGPWLLRSAVIVICLLIVAIVLESIRQ